MILHPLARHALVERRDFLRGAVASAVAMGGASGLLAACAGGSDSGASAVPGSTLGTLPPIPYDPTVGYWMQGGFAPVADETEAFDLEVTGALPSELDGLYVRNGSNPSSGPSLHWFLGDGMVHGVRLSAGRALWYRNRYVDTPLYRAGAGLLGAGAPGGAVNQSNVSAFHHAGRLLTSGEIGLPYELSVDDLSTTGTYDYGGALTTSMTAHPKIDPATGRMHFFGYGFVPPYLTYHVASPDGVLEHSVEIAVAGPTMIHDFAITDRDVVFWELPVVFDLDAAVALMGDDASASTSSTAASVTSSTAQSAAGGLGQGMPFVWDESYGARVGVMPLGGQASDIRWVEIDPCFVFHGINAHRDGDDVVIDVCRMPTVFKPGGDEGDSVPHRWRVGTAGDQLTFADEVLDDTPMDLPAIDRRFVGRSQRHAWLLMTEELDGYPIEFAGLAHRDHVTGTLDVYAPGPGERVNEGFVVPAGQGEGEGWLLTYAWDRARGASDLLVLDALDLAAGPVARVHLPVRVPYGFHGVWVPTS